MAKGKHGAAAAIRRAEAAHEHIDRLTDQLTEAKIRARRCEADASRVPALEGELARLRKQVTEETSDELEKLRARMANDRMLAEENLVALGRLLAVWQKQGLSGGHSEDVYDSLRELLGAAGYEEYLYPSDRPATRRASRLIRKGPSLASIRESRRQAEKQAWA